MSGWKRSSSQKKAMERRGQPVLHRGVSLSADPEPYSRTETRRQRRISNDFVVMIVQRILEVGIRRDAGVDRVPSAEIDAGVAWSVSEPETEKVGIWPTAYESSAQVSAPTRSQVGDEQTSNMLRTA